MPDDNDAILALIQSIDTKLDGILVALGDKCDKEDCEQVEQRVHSLETKVNRFAGAGALATLLFVGTAGWLTYLGLRAL